VENIAVYEPDTYDDRYAENYRNLEKDGQLQMRDGILWTIIMQYAPDIKTLIDIGCGEGFFLDHMPVELDLELFGYDPHIGGYKDKSVLGKEYDMMTFFHTLEHTEDPYGFINQTKHTYILFSIPWIGDLSPKIMLPRLLNPKGTLHIGEHKQFFTRRSLNILLRDYDVIFETHFEAEAVDKNHPNDVVTQIRRRIERNDV